MNQSVSAWSAATWLAVAAAWGQVDATASDPMRVRLNTGKILEVPFVRNPLSLRTAGGRVSFFPGELEGIVFSASGQCAVDTVYEDRWILEAGPEILRPLVSDILMAPVLDHAKAVSFPLSAPTPAPAGSVWNVELNDGSLAHLSPEQDALRVETADGKIDVPWELVESLRRPPGDIQAAVEISPGGYVLRGWISGSSFRAADLGGRRYALPWNSLVSLSRMARKPSPASSLLSEQEVVCQMIDQQPAKLRVPVSILTVNGRGGTWTLPTTRILRMMQNPDGSFSVQTTAGEWLTGSVKPKDLSLANVAEGMRLSFASCRSLTWAHLPVDLPANHLVWRLRTGDLLVGEWLADPVADPEGTVAPLRVRSPVVAAATRLPLQIDGKWPVSRFNVRHWADGSTLRLSASAVEAVRAGPASQMPPALLSSGPSAVWSDEVFVPGGAYRMGRIRGKGGDDEIPPVDLSVGSFWLANTPVTVAQFEAFAADTGHVTDPERTPAAPSWRAPGFAQRADAPVVCVSWRDAVRYCNWRSAQAGLTPCYDVSRDGQEVVFRPERNGYRLPLEAEWEYAARSGGQDVVYPWGDESDEETVADLANFRSSDSESDPWPWTNPVKAFPPSAAGFHDMGGNVWEWCQDVYRADAYAAALRGEGMEGLLNAAPGRDRRRVMRGGSYHNGVDYLRCAARGFGLERMNAPRVGFRVARNAEAGEL
ncbi:MAG: formylglycine-generating enzyme family protein [Kiritimatiellia bacterium]